MVADALPHRTGDLNRGAGTDPAKRAPAAPCDLPLRRDVDQNVGSMVIEQTCAARDARSGRRCQVGLVSCQKVSVIWLANAPN
jgi:hypothetical protein